MKTPPRVTAEPMEPGCSQWAVVVDNAHTPVYTDEVIAENLTQENAERIAEALNHKCSLPESIQWALNSGDGTYRP